MRFHNRLIVWLVWTVWWTDKLRANLEISAATEARWQPEFCEVFLGYFNHLFTVYLGIWVARSILKTVPCLVRNIWKVPNISPTHWVQRKPFFSLARRAGLNIVRWNWSRVQIKEANKHFQIFVKRSLNLNMFCFMLIDYTLFFQVLRRVNP